MIKSLIIALTTLLTSSRCFTTIRNGQQVLGGPDNEINIRPVVKEDLDDVVTTFLDAFGPGAIAQYTQFPDPSLRNYTHRCYLQLFEKDWARFEANELTFANVITVPRGPDEMESMRSKKVVSFAFWRWLEVKQERSSSFQFQPFHPLALRHEGKCSDHLDTNTTREAQVIAYMDDIERKYYSNLTHTELYLNVIATHPDWDGHGFGAAQVEYGLGKAKEAGANVTLVATPAGHPLYASLGFEAVANVTMQMFDGLGVLWLEYMRWNFEAEST
ncbi:hypothetical protein LTR78_008014 [Recurvomyces mirabilis]|uniref:N-acetyltransferase domain-containing protein n=1 Tax=Recurvomyces mirabilis TaxID=574656 RepID=A0AAE0WHU6_9PEZI|nr:hypothetical protein LTR78_008014 [Recurvomyces mirabilis]KAK5150741.1 hypothetical protein LTS14_009804 [Recurvomyces mirabilis]